MQFASVLTLLLLAIALAAQPWSVLAAVLLVASRRGMVKEVAYVAGWFLALLTVAVATIALYPANPKPTSTSATLSAIELVAGIAVAFWAFVRWRRPVQPSGSEQPKWMGRIDSMSPVLAFALGAFLPNYVLVVAAVTNVLEAGLPRGWAAGLVLAWVLVASLGVAAPLLVVVVRRDGAPVTFARWREWLVTNGSALVLGVLGVVGILLAVKGIVGLAT